MNEDTTIISQENDSNTNLVAYRVGRLEKALETFNENTVVRDDKIFKKLEAMSIDSSIIKESILRNSMRLDAVESTMKTLFKVVGAVALVLLGVVADIVVRLV